MAAKKAPGKRAAAKGITAKRTSPVKPPAKKTAPKKATPKEAAAKSTSPKKPAAKASSPDWRARTLARMRALIAKAVPDAAEEVKWRKPSNPAGVPTWSAGGGILCTGETYKDHVKLTFAKGAQLPDPKRLFNAGLEGNLRRAIDLREGETVDEKAFVELVRAAAELNAGATGAKAKPAKPRLLSGGNPQIKKGAGDAPVQAYIDALPGWKREVVQRIDALVAREAPQARKAVKWNSPFYGVPGKGWFLGVHAFTRYVKLTFFQGASLDPAPPGGTSKDARWVDVHEGGFDEKQLASWVRQAAARPGWLTSDIQA